MVHPCSDQSVHQGWYNINGEFSMQARCSSVQCFRGAWADLQEGAKETWRAHKQDAAGWG